MLRLLHIEFQKLRHNKAAKIITITYFVLITFIALIASIEYNFFGLKFRAAEQGIFNFPYIWHFNTYIAAWGFFINLHNILIHCFYDSWSKFF